MTSSVSAGLIKELREKTGAGLVDCKKALEESGADLEKAVELLQQKGLSLALKKQGRETSQGRIHTYIHATGRIGVLVEVNCETDFVANTDEFRALCHQIALQIAATAPKFVSRDQVSSPELEDLKTQLQEEASQSGASAHELELRLDSRLKEICLLEQPSIHHPEKNVELLIREVIAKLGENIAVKRYSRFEIGVESA